MNNPFIQKILLFFCVYIPFQLAINPAQGIDLASGRIIVLLLFGVWLLVGFKNKRIILPFKIQTLLLLSFLFLNSFSLIFAQNIGWSGRKLFFLLSFFPIYFIAASVAENKKGYKKIAAYLVFGAGLSAVIGLIQFLLPFIFNQATVLRTWAKIIIPFLGTSFSQSVLENSSWLVNLSGHTVFRAISFFPDPHMLSFYMSLTMPWALALYFSSGKRNNTFLVFFALILATDLLTFSRGGYMGLLAGVICALMFSWKTINRKSKQGLLAAIILMTLISLTPNPISKRFFSSFNLFEGSNQGRIETWSQSTEVIRNNPLTGVGLGNYPLEIKPSADYREPIYSHNLYLDIAAESGLLNAAVWILLIVASIIAFLRKARDNRFHLAGAVSLVMFSAHSIFETPLFSIHILPLLLIIIALSATKKNT